MSKTTHTVSLLGYTRLERYRQVRARPFLTVYYVLRYALAGEPYKPEVTAEVYKFHLRQISGCTSCRSDMVKTEREAVCALEILK